MIHDRILAMLPFAGIALIVVGLVFSIGSLAARNPDHSGLSQRLMQSLLSMDRTARIERFVYRHHQAFGFFILVGTLLTLGILTRQLTRHAFALPPHLVVTIGSIVTGIFFIGTVIMLRPSALKPLEKWANHQITPFPTTTATCFSCGIALILTGALLVFSSLH